MPAIFKFLISILLALLLTACGPKVKISTEHGQRLRTVFVLPPSFKSKIAREKIEYINSAFSRNLVANGFQVSSPQLLERVCPEGLCPDIKNLAAQTDSDIVARITVSDITSANILAGYFQSISGSAEFFDRNGKEVAKVQYTQRERGGLIFDSGQIVQGIRKTVGKLQDSSFTNLADKFVATLVAKLPPPGGKLEVLDLDFGKSSVESMGDGKYLGCVESSNAASANLQYGKTSIPLRPAGPKKFCAVFLLDLSNNKDGPHWIINLFGHYGETKSALLGQVPLYDCPTDRAVKRSGKTVRLLPNFENCQKLTFLIFEAANAEGPFILRGSLSKPGSSLTLRYANTGVATVVVVSDELGYSSPLFLN